MSAVGKSTVVEEIGRRGLKAVDLDQPGWSEYRRFDVRSEESEWLWVDDRIEDLLASHDEGTLYLSGCAANQGRFYPRFDRVVLLTASESVTVERLRARANNDFGKRPDELVKILSDKAEFEDRLRAGADIVIDTDDRPLDDVVERILEVGEARR